MRSTTLLKLQRHSNHLSRSSSGNGRSRKDRTTIYHHTNPWEIKRRWSYKDIQGGHQRMLSLASPLSNSSRNALMPENAPRGKWWRQQE
ncbi:hypothetical protein V6N12_000434 [Hibiscus sabdariffa]|uniref:Uncharacterized protein n=1 Tax=Hibiscus sabdariffa TaxID=183260 RepID=A0ABR2BI83_9ROSI